MEKLTVTAKREGTNERLVGTGVNVFDGQALLYNKYASYEVDPDTIRLNYPRTLPDFENPSVGTELLEKLHDKLVQTAIDFIKEHNIKDIDEIDFSADALQESSEYGYWTPATDSSFRVIGRQDGKRKLIWYNI